MKLPLIGQDDLSHQQKMGSSFSCCVLMQVILCEAGLLKQTLQVFVSQLRRVLDKGYNVADAFVPFLQGLVDDPTLACGHALHMATVLLGMHLQGIEVWPLSPVCISSNDCAMGLVMRHVKCGV